MFKNLVSPATTPAVRRSNYLWWALFTLLIYLVFNARYFLNYSSGNVNHIFWLEPIGGGQGMYLPIGSGWVAAIGINVLMALIVSLPLLLSGYRKILGIILNILIFWLAISYGIKELFRTDDGSGLSIIAIPALLWIFGIIFALLVGLPSLIQKKIQLNTPIRQKVIKLVIILELLAALVVSSFIVYISHLASTLPQNTSAEYCGRMEQASAIGRAWRTHYREHCPLGVGEELPFPVIADDKLKEYALGCQIEKTYESPTEFTGICLKDGSGYVTTHGDLIQEVLRQPDLDRGCGVLDIGLHYGKSEQFYLKEMQKVCKPPTSIQE